MHRIFVAYLVPVVLIVPLTVSLLVPGLVIVSRFRPGSGAGRHLKAEWRSLIGPGPARYCALIGWDNGRALLCQIDTAQVTLLGAFLSFRVFMA